MPQTTERQPAADMLKELLPGTRGGKVRVGVGIYDQARGRTYRAVTESQMVAYLEGVTAPQLRRLWRQIETVIKSDDWREAAS